MSDNTELKRLADELIAANDLFNESPQDNEVGDAWSLANDRFTEAASPEVILALIDENEQLSKTADCWDRLNVQNKALSDSFRAERDQLKAENERQAAQFKEWQASHHANYCKVAEERDELRAEIAGFKTGYEAYDRANAELKAEVEGLRKLGPSKEIIWCACGDGYPVNSHGAGFMDANNGVCANCDSANQGAEPDLDAPNSLAVLRKALSDLLALYDEDEGCRNLPQYIAGRAAMGKGEQSEGGHQAGHKSSESIDSEGLEGGLQ